MVPEKPAPPARRLVIALAILLVRNARPREPPCHTQSPGRTDEPVPAPAPVQPGRLVPVGPGGARQGRRRRASRSSSRSATPPATGATSWSASRSRTRRSPKLLNASFVAIKVDREERPDLDEIYMHGGSVDDRPRGLAAERLPDARRQAVLRRNLLPPEDRYGRPGFPALLAAINEAWSTRRDDVDRLGGGHHIAPESRVAASRQARGRRAGRPKQTAARGRRSEIPLRRDLGRLRPGAEVPAARGLGAAAARARAHR